MNGRSIRALMNKDIRVITSSAQLWLPMAIVPLVFVVLLPAALLIVGRAVNMGGDSDDMQFVARFLNGIPEGSVRDTLATFTTFNQQFTYLMLNYLLAPLFLIVPTMVSSIVAAASFVGEKEKKTLETLLFSPMAETDMFVAKILAALLPSMALTLGGFVLFSLEFMALGAPLFGRMLWPAPHWLAMVLWLAPAMTLLMIFLNVLVSAKVKGFQEAQQLSVIVILPILFLLYGQIGGIVYLSTWLTLAIGAVFFAVDAVLIRFAARSFNRDKLFRTQVL